MNIRDIEAAVSAIEESYIQEAGKTIGGQGRPTRRRRWLRRSFFRSVFHTAFRGGGVLRQHVWQERCFFLPFL